MSTSSILSGALSKEIENAGFMEAEFTLGGEKHKVCATPINAADFNRINAYLMKKNRKTGHYVSFQNDPMQFDGQIQALINKTHMLNDGDMGDKAFNAADKMILEKMGVDKISNMFGELFGDQITEDDAEGDIKEAEGNS